MSYTDFLTDPSDSVHRAAGQLLRSDAAESTRAPDAELVTDRDTDDLTGLAIVADDDLLTVCGA